MKRAAPLKAGDSRFTLFYIKRRSLTAMLGILFNDKECKELDYVLRKELDEMLLDLGDSRLDGDIKQAITRRYKIIFRMYARIASPKELSRYALNARNYR
jgi:hypothetical protein